MGMLVDEVVEVVQGAAWSALALAQVGEKASSVRLTIFSPGCVLQRSARLSAGGRTDGRTSSPGRGTAALEATDSGGEGLKGATPPVIWVSVLMIDTPGLGPG